VTLFPLNDIGVSMLAPLSGKSSAYWPRERLRQDASKATEEGIGEHHEEHWNTRERQQTGAGRGSVAAGGRRWHATLIKEYEARLAIARERFDQHPAVRTLFRDPIDPVTLEAGYTELSQIDSRRAVHRVLGIPCRSSSPKDFKSSNWRRNQCVSRGQ
jgi:hypothetical protein